MGLFSPNKWTYLVTTKPNISLLQTLLSSHFYDILYIVILMKALEYTTGIVPISNFNTDTYLSGDYKNRASEMVFTSSGINL